METLINRIATSLSYGQTRKEIFDNYVGFIFAGVELRATVEDVWLAIEAAQILNKDR